MPAFYHNIPSDQVDRVWVSVPWLASLCSLRSPAGISSLRSQSCGSDGGTQHIAMVQINNFICNGTNNKLPLITVLTTTAVITTSMVQFRIKTTPQNSITASGGTVACRHFLLLIQSCLDFIAYEIKTNNISQAVVVLQPQF